MSLKDKKRNLVQKLKDMNYTVEGENEDSITFLSGRTYFVLQLYEGTNDYYRLVLPNFLNIKNIDPAVIYRVINEINKEYRLIKILYVNESLWVSLECFFESEKLFLKKLEYLLHLSKLSALKVRELIDKDKSNG